MAIPEALPQGSTNVERACNELPSSGSLEQDSTLPTGGDGPTDQAADDPEDGDVFLGESNVLHYVPQEVSPDVFPSPKHRRARHSIPHAVKAETLMPQWAADRRRVRFKSLHDDGSLSFPSGSVRIALLKAYFRWFHPHFAVVDESEAWALHSAGTMSPLLLQAMLFIGVIHCEEGTLEELGWGNRHRAKYLFYSRAKDIYDAEYEPRKLTVIQALFLMSFWRAGAVLEKDARHWLGAAITLAQTKALHRSSVDMDRHVASLRRRIWWSIYVRERQCASALGLPNRIRDDDCDVEPLSPTDFASAFDPSQSLSVVERYTHYAIGIMQLSRALGRIVDAAYLPNRTLTATDRAQIREELSQWKHNLPRSMQLISENGEQPSFQSSMLHLAYNNLLILLHRSAFVGNEDTADKIDGTIALQAAARNSRIVEDMLPGGHVGHAQIHAITNLFNTLCIHVTSLQRSSGINRTIAEHRAKLCLLGLQELQKTWEVTNWVLQLFLQYLDRTTAARLEITQNAPSLSTDTSSTAQVQDLDMSTDVATEEAYDKTTPWSWTTDEANQYLFAQIESDFAFGEGGVFEWSPDGPWENGTLLPDLGYETLNPIF